MKYLYIILRIILLFVIVPTSGYAIYWSICNNKIPLAFTAFILAFSMVAVLLFGDPDKLPAKASSISLEENQNPTMSQDK